MGTRVRTPQRSSFSRLEFRALRALIKKLFLRRLHFYCTGTSLYWNNMDDAPCSTIDHEDRYYK
jgi:hypothetical protein